VFDQSEICRLLVRLPWECEQLTTVLQEKIGDHQPARKASSSSGRRKDVEKRDCTIFKRTFLRSPTTVLAHSLATRGQKYLV
jgi:hypothetical protein